MSQQHEDPAEAATLPYDPEESSFSLQDNGRVEEHENHDDPTIPVDPPTQDSQQLYRNVLAHNPALRPHASLRNPDPDAREMLDREIAMETEFGLNRSPDTSQKSTLTDTQFSSSPHRLQVREYEGSDSSQVMNELRRYTNPLNDLGSQDSIKTQFCVDNYDRQHRMDIKGPKRSNSAIVDDGPEFKRQRYQGVYQQNSDLTDYLGDHYQAKCFFTDKQKALINPRFQMQKYPDRERAKTFAGKLSATARLHGNATRAVGPRNSGIIDNLPPVTVEQLKYNYNLSLSSDDMQGSPESQRNPYISPQRPYTNRSQEDTSPLRYPSPNHPSSSGSSLGHSGREASTQSVSSHGRVSNMSSEVRAYEERYLQVYFDRQSLLDSEDAASETDINDAYIGEFYRWNNLDDEPEERALTPELEDSSIPRDEVQDYGLSPSNESDPTGSALPPETIQNTAEDIPSTTNDVASTTEDVPPITKDVASTTEDVASTTEDVPSTTEDIPSATNDVPSTTNDVPSTTVDAHSTAKDVSSTTNDVPSTTNDVPSTAKEGSSTTEEVAHTTHAEPTASGSTDTSKSTSQSQNNKKNNANKPEVTTRRSSRIKEHAKSADFKAEHIKVMLSSAIDKTKRAKYKKFLDNKGAMTDDWSECTVYVSADIRKDTTGSICALIMGKDVVGSPWLDKCIEEQAFIGYKCREFPRAKLSEQPMKGKKLYFSKDCGFRLDEKKHISNAVGATLVRAIPKTYQEEMVVVIKDSDDPVKDRLTDIGFQVTPLDDFIAPLARSL